MDALVGKALRSRRVRFWLATAGIATGSLAVAGAAPVPS